MSQSKRSSGAWGNGFEELERDEFTGVAKLKRRTKATENKVGLGDVPTPTVTGGTDALKLESLLTGLAALGLIKRA